MLTLLKPNVAIFFLQTIKTLKVNHVCLNLYCTDTQLAISTKVKALCDVICNGIGSLDDLESGLESSINQNNVTLSSLLVTQVIDSCKNEAPTRRLLRFFIWCKKKMDFDLCDEDFNHVIQVFAKKKDFMSMEILIADLARENRKMDAYTFGAVAETLVKLNREDVALGIFKNLENFKCIQDEFTVTAIVNALCLKGHAKRAERVVWHHKNAIAGSESCIYKSLLYGWTVKENVKEARKIIKEMKSVGIKPDLYCFNTFLRCLCKRNLKANPSGLVPEALNVMMEMRTYGVIPTSISYNILLSCLAKTRRVKECLRMLELMRKSGCSPDWISYYLVVRVLYLSGRFGKGNQITEMMTEEDGLIPERKFYYDLIGVLCGVERVNYAIELFGRMKKSRLGGYGPVYDVLIPKLCRGGEFEKGKQLWDEAVAMGVSLSFSSNVLDPMITEVFVPTRKVEDESLLDPIPIIEMKKMKYANKGKKKNMRNVGKT